MKARELPRSRGAAIRRGLRIANAVFGALLAVANASAAPDAVDVVEFYNAAQDHYFLSSLQPDITALDTEKFKGWVRTGASFRAYGVATAGASPVCRFYIPPAYGDSHFLSASPAECAQTASKFPYLQEESTNVMYVDLPDAVTGACPSGDIPVYRVFDNRSDANHRYTTDIAVRDAMKVKGWIAEGYGPNAVIMCAPDAPIPSGFFAVSTVSSDFPGVTMGLLAHQEFAWGRIEQAKGVFDFSLFDGYLAAAKQNGLVDASTNVANVAMTLAAGTPGWAVADPSTCSTKGSLTLCTAPPDHIKDWTDFIDAVIKHYDGATRPHVKYYELWNEFNVALWWTGRNEDLVSLAAAAYPIVHKDPYSALLTPSVAGPVGAASPNSGVTAMTQYLQAGGARYADGGAFHGYIAAQNGDFTFPMPEQDTVPGCKAFVSCYGSIVTKATQMRDVFDQNGLAGKPMHQTEGSWGNDTITDPETQVEWVSRYSLLQAGLRTPLNLRMAAWFTWAQPSFGWGDIESANGNPNAAGRAYTEVYHWLVGATIASPCASGADGTWTCTLTRPGGYVGKAVWNVNGTLDYAPGAGFGQYRDLSGNTSAIPASGKVAIGPKPILVERTTATPAGAPNILLVLTDDQDVQTGTPSYMPFVKSLLADQGTSFTNAFVPLSLCCPSRTTILRGQLPHNTGVLTNMLPDGGFERAYLNNIEASTIATVLHDAGYRTVLLGKYLNGYPGASNGNYVPPGWDEWYSPIAGDPYGEYNYVLNENGTRMPYGMAPTDYLTDVIYAKAKDFIQRAASTPSQPLFIYFATYAPHSPYTPAPRHANLFSDLKAPRPPSFNEANVGDKPLYMQSKPLLTQADIDGIDADYRDRLRALQAVDEAVSGLVATLKATGRLANTYIVFASDNGYHMGEHRMQPGKYTPYETDIHVPFIVRGPGVASGVTLSQLVSNIDLAPTFADIAGLTPLSFSDGRSLVPLLRNPSSTPWRQTFPLEEFGSGANEPTDRASATPEPLDKFDIAAKTTPAATIPSYYGFFAPGYKYVEYATGEKELYTAADTYELNNVASSLSPALAAALSLHVKAYAFCAGDTCRGADMLVPPALSP